MGRIIKIILVIIGVLYQAVIKNESFVF